MAFFAAQKIKNMKKLWLVSLVFVLAAACKNDDSGNTKLASGEVTIKGEVEGATGGILEILSASNTEKIDTVKLENGKFSYTTKLDEPVQMAVRKPGTSGEELVFFADPGEISIKANNDSLWAGEIKGGKTQKIYKEAEDSLKAIMASGKSLYDKYMQAQQMQNPEAMQQIEREFIGLQDKAEGFAVNFSKQHNNTVIAPFLGIMYLSQEGKEAELKKLYDTLTLAVKSSFFGKKIGDKLKASQGTNVGATAADFTLPDVDGNPVSLSSYKGKYVLVDFWASWCGPCRQENPNVVKAYNEYKSKGFDVLGVSLDKSKEAWVKAIDDDNLAWTHVSDLKYWDNEVAKLYGVQAIPTNYLIDKNGVIIGKNLRGEALEAKLKEVMN